MTHFNLNWRQKLGGGTRRWRCLWELWDPVFPRFLGEAFFLLQLGNTWAHNVKHFWRKKQTNSACQPDDEPTLNLLCTLSDLMNATCIVSTTTPRRIIPNLVASCHCTGSGISFGKWDFCCSGNVCFSHDDNLKSYFGFRPWHRHDYYDHKLKIKMMMKIKWKAWTMMISRTILDPQLHRFIFYTLWRNLMFMAPLARQH